MSWFDEIPQLCRRSMTEIGFAFYVREKMHNKLVATEYDLRLTLGPEWREILDHLVKDGIMTSSMNGKFFVLSVKAPGDKKRERCRTIGRKNRTFAKLEKSIIKKDTNEKDHKNP